MPFKDIEKRRASARKYRANNLARESRYGKAWHLRTTYGLSLEQFDGMVAAQNGLCAICCETMKPGHGTHIDHCHKTGKIRKLLCSRCNQAIGLLREDTAIVKSALDYLEEHQ